MISVLSRPFGSMHAPRHRLAAKLLIFSGAAFGQSSSDFAPVDNAHTYGGFFEFRKRNLSQIRVRATLPETGRVIEKTF